MNSTDKQEEQTTETAPTAEGRESAPTEAVVDYTTELENQLSEKTKEAQENYQRMLRYAAEMENLKKRQERERVELLQYANENLLKELLPVLDNLERAMEHGRALEAPPALVEGVERTQQEFLRVLNRFGVSKIDSLGQAFDPAYHHAVMEEENPEVAPLTVLKELQKGYLYQNRLLRPALVVVARNPQKSEIDVTV